jgi:hypothetical protein
MINIVILAQGTQKRLGNACGPKQLLSLAACVGAPILVRTLRQLGTLAASHDIDITVVTWKDVWVQLVMRFADAQDSANHVELADPGNSSLKGIARYLAQRDSTEPQNPEDRTIVLLGDVCYSWAALNALLLASREHGFVGTSNLSESGGELWGVAWKRKFEDQMLRDLGDALLRHPPFEDEYQPGQMRRWILGWRKGSLAERVDRLRRSGLYFDIDDYTMDVDLAVHIPKLAESSVLAREDDIRNGMTWNSPPR